MQCCIYNRIFLRCCSKLARHAVQGAIVGKREADKRIACVADVCGLPGDVIDRNEFIADFPDVAGPAFMVEGATTGGGIVTTHAVTAGTIATTPAVTATRIGTIATMSATSGTKIDGSAGSAST